MSTIRILLLAVAFAPGAAWAQTTVPQPEAALVVTEGAVLLQGSPVDAGPAPVVLPPDAVVMTIGGRAAIALKHGGWLFLERGATARVLANGVYNFNRIEILEGSAIVASGTSSPLVACESDIHLSNQGWFRFDTQPLMISGERQCQFRVFDGAAAVPLASLTNALRAGQSMVCDRRCGDMIPTMEFARDQLDDFDRWARGMAR